VNQHFHVSRLIDRAEQRDRVPFQGTPNYTEKSSAQIINDRERTHLYDRIPWLSNNYGAGMGRKTVSNPMLPQIQGYGDAPEYQFPDQKRSVWSSAGVLFVLDKELGVIAINRYGEAVS